MKYIDIYEVVSKNIKRVRKEKKLKQHELAEKAELSYEFIRRIESKKSKKSFSIETIYIISLALDVPLGDLFKLNEEE